MTEHVEIKFNYSQSFISDILYSFPNTKKITMRKDFIDDDLIEYVVD